MKATVSSKKPEKEAVREAAKPAAKPAKPAKAAAREADDRPSISDVIRSVNAQMKNDVIRRSSEMETLYLLRRPSGIITLDIELGGGFPASATTVLVGPDGAGKDYLLWKTAAECQKIYGKEFCMAVYFTEFKADKPFMRDFCGLQIAFSEAEVEAYDEAGIAVGKPALTAERRKELKTQVGEILIIDGVIAETAFDAIMTLVESNRCQMVIINSIGSLQTDAKEAADSFSDFPQQSNEAMLINKFIPKLANVLNNDRNGRNETSLFIVNQMRSKRDAQPVRGRPAVEKDKYEPGSKSWALKHGKAIELALHKGPVHRDAADNSVAGRKIRWEITKGKLGTHDGKSGEWDFFYDGGVDVVGDLVAACQRYELFEGASWITYEHPEYGFKVHGKEGVRRRLIESPELITHLRYECLRKAGLVYRYK